MSQLNRLEFSKCVSQNWLHFQNMVANYDYNTDNNEEIISLSIHFQNEDVGSK